MYIVRPKVLYTIKEEAITVLQIWRYWSMWTLNYTKCHLTRLFDRMMTLSDLLATKQDLPKYIGTSICRTTPGNDKYIYLSRNNDCSTAICTYHTRWKCMVNVKVMAIKFIVCSRQGLFIRVFFCLCLYIPVPCSLIGEQSLYAAFIGTNGVNNHDVICTIYQVPSSLLGGSISAQAELQPIRLLDILLCQMNYIWSPHIICMAPFSMSPWCIL